MSTRASIRIIEDGNQILLYHHCDGYPEGVGAELKSFLQEYEKKKSRYSWNAEDIASGLATKKNKWGQFPYECAISKHGDEEYVYVIDCDKQTLTCYSCNWDESFEECCVPARICDIP